MSICIFGERKSLKVQNWIWRRVSASKKLTWQTSSRKLRRYDNPTQLNFGSKLIPPRLVSQSSKLSVSVSKETNFVFSALNFWILCTKFLNKQSRESSEDTTIQLNFGSKIIPLGLVSRRLVGEVTSSLWSVTMPPIELCAYFPYLGQNKTQNIRNIVFKVWQKLRRTLVFEREVQNIFVRHKFSQDSVSYDKVVKLINISTPFQMFVSKYPCWCSEVKGGE